MISCLHGWQTIANVYPKGQNKEREEKMEEKEEMLENQVSSGTLPWVLLISSLVNLYHVSLWLFCHFVCPFLLGPSWETPELKNELDFFSGTNRPLASSARAQDIRTYENSSADWSRESGFPSEVSKAICFGLVCFSGAPARAKRAWDRAPYS